MHRCIGKLCPCLTAVGLLFVGAHTALADTSVSWANTAVSSNWNNANNWNPVGVPNGSYAVTLPTPSGSYTVTLDTDIAIDSMTMNAGATFVTDPGLDFTVGTLNINGGTNSFSPGDFLISGTSSATLAVVNNTADFAAGGSSSGAVIDVTGTLNNEAGAFTGVGSGDTANVNSLINSGEVYIMEGGTLNLTGGGSGVTDIPQSAFYDVGGAFNVDNGSVSTSALANLQTIEGHLRLEPGQSPTLGSLTISSTGTLGIFCSVMNGPQVIAPAGLAAPSITSAGSVSVTGDGADIATMSISGVYKNTSPGDLDLTDASISVGSLNNTGIIMVDSASTLTIAGGGVGTTDIPHGAIYDIGGAFNIVNGGVPSYALANVSTIEGIYGWNIPGQGISMGSVTVSSTGEFETGGGSTGLAGGGTFSATSLTVGGFVESSGNGSQVNGLLTITSTGQLNIQNSLFNAGSLNNQGFLNINPGGTFNITGGGAGFTDIPGTARYSLSGALNLDNGTIVTNPLSTVSTIEGFLQWGYTLAPLVMSQSVTVNSGTLEIDSGSVTVNGNLDSIFIGHIQAAGGLAVSGKLSIGSNCILNVEANSTHAVTSAAELDNYGQIIVNNVDSLLIGTGTPGASDGFQEYSNGTFDEIIGGTSSALYGRLFPENGSPAILGGTLDVTLANGFTPTPGQSWVFISSGANDLSGVFNSVSTGYPGGYFSVVYNDVSGTVTLVATAPEPTSLGLLGASAFAAIRRRRRWH